MRQWIFSFAALSAAALLPATASAQSLNLPLKEKYVDTIMASGSFSGGGQDLVVYTVPNKRLFRLTDLWMTNTGSQACDYRIFVGPRDTREFTAQPRSTFTLNLSTGLLFEGPTTVTIRNTPIYGGAVGCGVVTITGVLTKESN